MISTVFKSLYLKVSRILPFMPFIMTLILLNLFFDIARHGHNAFWLLLPHPVPTCFSYTPIISLLPGVPLQIYAFPCCLKPGGFNQGHLCDCGWGCRPPPGPGELTPFAQMTAVTPDFPGPSEATGSIEWGQGLLHPPSPSTVAYWQAYSCAGFCLL